MHADTREFDPDYPCIFCNRPVVKRSMAGPKVCPWCDAGKDRANLRRWTIGEARKAAANARRRLREERANGRS